MQDSSNLRFHHRVIQVSSLGSFPLLFQEFTSGTSLWLFEAKALESLGTRKHDGTQTILKQVLLEASFSFRVVSGQEL